MAGNDLASSHKKKHYRLDIQGLRGIAVLLVVLYHADLVFSGGYIGVDIFFVLSGFVIAQVLLRELQKNGRIDFKRFYQKRFRRLLPAAALCSVVTLIGAAILLSPTGPQQFAIRTAMAASLFVSNLYLFRGGGYFDAAAEANPFLHMWSLSVEEQFYFVLPVTMALVWMWVAHRRKKRDDDTAPSPIMALILVVTAAGTLSLLLSTTLATHPHLFPFDADSFGFFFPLTRVWEFSAGVILALSANKIPTLSSRMALWWGIAGAGFILYAALTFDAHTAFPGYAALLPVMGTVLLLAAGEASKVVHDILALKPLCWMGDISYSWYLWHWPLIVFAPILFPEAGWWLLPLAGFGAALPAWLSYKYMEEPIRRNRAIIGPAARRLAIGCIGIVLLVGAALSYGASKHWAMTPPSGWSELPVAFELPCEGPLENWERHRCTFSPPADVEAADKPPILLVGDSHTAALSNGLIEAANELGYEVMVLWMPSCPFLKERSVYGDHRCARFQDQALQFIEDTPLSLVVFGVYANNYVLSPHHAQHRVIESRTGTRPTSHEEALGSWQEAVENTLQALDDIGVSAMVAAPVPFYRQDPTLGWSLFRPEPLVQKWSRRELATRQATIKEANQRAHSQVENNTTYFDPVDPLCDRHRCTPVIDDQWLYLDEGHLNATGSLYLSPALQNTLKQALDIDSGPR